MKNINGAVLDYIGTREAVIERLDVSFILNQFGNNLAQAQERYKKFVMDNMEMEMSCCFLCG